MGRCFCKCHRFYRYVANDKEKSRKLVLVDRDEYYLHSSLFYKRTGIHQCLLYCITVYGAVGTDRMEETGKSNACLKKSSSSAPKAPAKAP